MLDSGTAGTLRQTVSLFMADLLQFPLLNLIPAPQLAAAFTLHGSAGAGEGSQSGTSRLLGQNVPSSRDLMSTCLARNGLNVCSCLHSAPLQQTTRRKHQTFSCCCLRLKGPWMEITPTLSVIDFTDKSKRQQQFWCHSLNKLPPG